MSDNDEAIVIKCNYSDNPWFPDELEKERVNWLRRDPEGYKTVWEGECRPAVEGAIYALEITRMQAEKRLGKAPYDPLLKVHTVWDLGWNDSMSIGFVQRSGSGEIRIIDYIEDHIKSIDADMNSRCETVKKTGTKINTFSGEGVPGGYFGKNRGPNPTTNNTFSGDGVTGGYYGKNIGPNPTQTICNKYM